MSPTNKNMNHMSKRLMIRKSVTTTEGSMLSVPHSSVVTSIMGAM